MRFPFEVPFSEVEANLDEFVTAVFSCLASEFLVMPKGVGFIDYPVFEKGYEALKQATSAFEDITDEPILRVAFDVPISIIVIRTILGFTPPEWAYLATQRTDIQIDRGLLGPLIGRFDLPP